MEVLRSYAAAGQLRPAPGDRAFQQRPRGGLRMRQAGSVRRDHVGGHGPRVKGRVYPPVLVIDRERPFSLRIIQYDQHHLVCMRMEGHIRQRIIRIRAYTDRTRPDEFRRVGDDIIGRVTPHPVPIDGDGAETTVATTPVGMRFINRIGGQVPFDHYLTPVTRRPDDQLADMFGDVPAEIARTTDPLLGKVEVLIGKGIVYCRQGVNFSPIQMESRSINILPGLRIVQDRDRVLRVIGIMVVNNDFGI